MSDARTFDVHGLHLRVGGRWTDLVEKLDLDFAWFADQDKGGPTDFEVVVDESPQDIARHGDVVAWSISPRSIVYRLPDGRTITDYLGLASAELDSAGRRLEVHGRDTRLAYEAAFNGARATVIRHLDRRGLMTFHAVALSGRAGAVVVLLPSGGGKSSLAVRALELDGVRLLSDDMPILDRNGYVHPFPIRIGVTMGDPALANRSGRTIEHLGWRPKLAIELADIADRIQREPVPLAHLVVATRTTGSESRLEPAHPRDAWSPLLRESVFRVPAGHSAAAWVTSRRTVGSTTRHVRPVLQRARLCRTALGLARTWRLVLGTDRDGNARALAPLLTESPGTGARR